jgi:adenosylhomocysteine nucleosidase
MRPRTAIIAALPREVAPLVRGWRDESDRANKVHLYTCDAAVVAHAGMGAERAAMAARRALQSGPVSQIISAGWAGALQTGWDATSVCFPAYVVDATDGQRYATHAGKGTLVTVTGFAHAEEKRRLRAEHAADFVDMEAAAVAKIAAEQGLPFAAVKAISDGPDEALPDLQRFYSGDGQFRELAFALYLAARPWLWPVAVRMGTSATRAAKNLCRELDRIVRADGAVSTAQATDERR